MNLLNYRVVVAFFCLYASSAGAVQVLSEGFNNSSLDPLWTITQSGTNGFSYAETSSRLEVYDIYDNSVGSGWASVTLSYDFQALTDFDVRYNFGFDNRYWFYGSNYPTNTNLAMQGFSVGLYDSTGSLVVSSGYHDAWRDTDGEFDFQVGVTNYHTGQGSSGYGDNKVVQITRNNGTTNIYWDNAVQLSGNTTADISKIGITFKYFDHLSGGYHSIFGNEYISLLSIDGTLASSVTPVPAPGAVWLFGSGLLSLLATRKGVSTLK